MKRKILSVFSAAALLTAFSVQADVREGLVAYWPLNTASGSYPMTTPDVVAGNDMAGAYMDSATALVGGHFGDAVSFDGGSGYLTFQAPSGADLGLPVSKKGCWTISMWVNGASQAGGNYYCVESSSMDNNPLTAFTARANTNTTAIYFRDASANNPVNMPAVTNISLDGTWHHVAMTYDAVSHAFLHYVDGSLVYSNNFVPNYSNNGVYDLVNLGARNRNGVQDLYFAGKVDDLALWARTLSQAEIQQVMANGITTPVPAFAPGVTVGPHGATNLVEGDTITLATASYGTRPLYYQWQKNGTNYPGATTDSLTLPNVVVGDSGAYTLVITNSSASTTSAVAQIVVNSYVAPNLTNGMVAYYPCDAVVAGKTPDLVSAYDMTLVNMSSGDLITGKWGSALQFSKSPLKYGKRSPALPNDALPVFRRANCTISVWVQGMPHSGIFLTEGNSANNNTQFTFGDNYSDKLAIYFRTDANVVLNGWSETTAAVWDGNWHNVVYVQHDVGGSLVANIYVDGNLDPIAPHPNYQLTVDGDGFCWLPRPNGSSGGNFALDEVVYWNRALSPAEIALLQTGYITNPPTRLTPLAIGSFKADLAAVVSGDSTKLRWDVPANITSAYISNVGDVTGITAAGGGTTNIAVLVTNTTTYKFTITRGNETVSKSVTIGAVKGVAAGWSLLDNFDFYQAGKLGTNSTWYDMYENTAAVVQPAGGNRQARINAVSGAGGAYLYLNDLAVTAGQARTLFFRVTPQGSPVDVIRQFLGLSDRVASFYYQWASQYNAGPLAYPQWKTDSSSWSLAVSTWDSGGLIDGPMALTAGSVYRVWIDITNVAMVNPFGSRVEPDEEDLYSVYIQKEGDASRTALFSDVVSDRDLNTQDEYSAHQPDDNINRLVLGSNGETDGALFDDIYLSKSGYNSTTPIGAGYAGPPPMLQLQKVGGQWQIIFEGELQEADAATGAWSKVTGATSPYPLPTTGEKKFYRAASY
jgi:hypothetical protein